MRDKQIEEMVKVISDEQIKIANDSNEFGKLMQKGVDYCHAEALYNAGYRKKSDVAREIISDMRELIKGYENIDVYLDRIEKKYEILNSWEELTHTCQVEIPHTIESIADLAFPESEGDR